MPETIRDLQVATIRASLPEPIAFGDWVMRHREFALVRLRSESDVEGYAFTLTRDGPIAATIKKVIEHHYVGSTVSTEADAAALFSRCQGSNLAGLSSGIGLRALSVVELATHDLLARAAGLSIPAYLGGRSRLLPATAIIGYPPASMPPEAVARQVETLRSAGWRRFKIPIALPLEVGRERLLAAREAAGEDSWLGMDAAWIFRDVDSAVEFLEGVRDVRLDWFEDAFPPGDAQIVSELRERAGVPIAMGDEQGGSYYPEALLLRGAVDVVRIDATCMGGITGTRRLISQCEEAAAAFAPHMFAHVHSQIFGGLGHDVPIEWGVRWTGVDQFADSLRQPVIVEGMMEPLDEQAGFGPLVNPDWLREQDLDDPDGLVGELTR